jgi:hypothetical protein
MKTFALLNRISTLLIGINLTLCTTPEKPRNGISSFYIDVRDFSTGEGYSIEYLLSMDSIKMFSNCDFEGCEDKQIYAQKLDDTQLKRFTKFISILRLDTLKNKYLEEGNDGLSRQVAFQKNSDRLKYIYLERFDHPIIDTLVSEIRNLITVEKFRTMR